jgi:hypothetical protein
MDLGIDFLVFDRSRKEYPDYLSEY